MLCKHDWGLVPVPDRLLRFMFSRTLPCGYCEAVYDGPTSLASTRTPTTVDQVITTKEAVLATCARKPNLSLPSLLGTPLSRSRVTRLTTCTERPSHKSPFPHRPVRRLTGMASNKNPRAVMNDFRDSSSLGGWWDRPPSPHPAQPYGAQHLGGVV